MTSKGATAERADGAKGAGAMASWSHRPGGGDAGVAVAVGVSPWRPHPNSQVDEEFDRMEAELTRPRGAKASAPVE